MRRQTQTHTRALTRWHAHALLLMLFFFRQRIQSSHLSCPVCGVRACVFASAPARVDDVDDDVSDALSRRVLSGFCAVGWAPCRPVSADVVDVVDARHVGVSASFGVVTTINRTDVRPEYLIW